MIFLNIDYDYFFDSQEDVSLNDSKKRWVNPIGFFSKIDNKLVKEKYCFLDHHKALYHWDKIDCEDIHCIHIDAHHDLYVDEINDWNIPDKFRGNFIGVGNYLFRALLEKKISSITWVIPDWLDKNDAELDLEKYIGKGFLKSVSIIYYNELKEISDEIFLTISISPEWIPDPDKEILEVSKFLKGCDFKGSVIEEINLELMKRWGIKDFNQNALKYRFKFPYDINPHV